MSNFYDNHPFAAWLLLAAFVALTAAVTYPACSEALETCWAACSAVAAAQA
jgi:hypothetical protein